MRSTVLLLSHSQAHFTVDRVAAALAQRGARPIRLDTDRFPREVRLSARLGTHRVPEQPGYVIESGATTVETEDVQAVWMHKIWKPQLGDDLDPQFQEACERESIATLRGFLDGLHAARWVDDLGRITLAENKLRQLRLAQAAGLQIPRTLVTNDPEQVRAFFREVGGAMVAKLATPLSISMDASSEFVYTSEVHEQDLAAAESLRYSPMIFQERIPKARELRVAFVAGRLFVGALDASRSAAGRIDWRRATPEECAWERDQIPDQVAGRLHALMDALGLIYAAIDIIRTPTGEHIFLEVNPSGEWGMLERDLGYPIAKALAGALVGD
jgi:MvdC family ATP-grasp ribosomal peptide maturase